MLHSFPNNAVWIWENLDAENIKNIFKFTNEINAQLLGKDLPDEEEQVTIDVNDPKIKSQLDNVKKKLGII